MDPGDPGDQVFIRDAVREFAVFPRSATLTGAALGSATGVYGSTLDSFVEAVVLLKTNMDLRALGTDTQNFICITLDALCNPKVVDDLALLLVDGVVLQRTGVNVVHLRREGAGGEGRTVLIEVNEVLQRVAQYKRLLAARDGVDSKVVATVIGVVGVFALCAFASRRW